MKSISTVAVLGWIASKATALGPDCVNGALKSNKVCDTTASPADRAAALVNALQQQEKLNNLVRYLNSFILLDSSQLIDVQ
jgi:xylan 1,4-beta-xylosidase